MPPLHTLRTSTATLCLLFLLFAPYAHAADYNNGVTARVLKKTTVTGNGEKIVYPRTDQAEVTAMTVELAPGPRPAGINTRCRSMPTWSAAT